MVIGLIAQALVRHSGRAVLFRELGIHGDNPSQEELSTALRRAVMPVPEPGVMMSLEDMEAVVINRHLTFHMGNRRRAAASLGLARSTLLAKIRKYGIVSPPWKGCRPG